MLLHGMRDEVRGQRMGSWTWTLTFLVGPHADMYLPGPPPPYFTHQRRRAAWPGEALLYVRLLANPYPNPNPDTDPYQVGTSADVYFTYQRRGAVCVPTQDKFIPPLFLIATAIVNGSHGMSFAHKGGLVGRALIDFVRVRVMASVLVDLVRF